MSRRAIVTGDELQFVVFRLGEHDCAFSIAQVERILRYAPPEPWADGPTGFAGRVGYGGQLFPLLDLRVRGGLRPSFHEETRVMVLAIESLPLAVVVDRVTEVVRVDTKTIQPGTATIEGLPPESGGGLIARPGRTIQILNAARLLTAAERTALSEAHR